MGNTQKSEKINIKMSKKLEVQEKNEVHQNAIWRETIRKENMGEKLHSKYAFNPYNLNKMQSVSDKPNTKLSKDNITEDKDVLVEMEKMSTDPNNKYKFTKTEAMEYGWFDMNYEYDNSDDRLRKPRQNSEITKYMDAAWRLKEQTENLQ